MNTKNFGKPKKQVKMPKPPRGYKEEGDFFLDKWGRQITPLMGVKAININTKKKRTFRSIRQAERILEVDKKCIYRILRGTQKQSKGWTFEYIIWG